MKLEVTLITICLIVIVTRAERKCFGVHFNNRYYDIHIIKDGLNHVHGIVLNPNDNTIYFIFDQISKEPTTALGYITLDTNQAGVIDGIRNPTDITIHRFFNELYVSGADGIYRITRNKIPEKMSITNEYVQNVFFKDVLYYVNRRKMAYKYDNEVNSLVPELNGVEIDKLVIDGDDNLFFLQGNKLFRVKLGTRAINTHEMYSVNFITTDAYYRPYICVNDGVYAYNKYKYAWDKVSDVTNLKAITFNKQFEPIYVVSDLIVKLNYSYVPCHDF